MKPLKLSKRINIFAVVFLLLIGITIGGFLVLKSKTGIASISQQLAQILEQNKEPIADCQPDSNDKSKDSDNDGLMDWQEATWQTDPCRADTDGDGYVDGEEVASGYSPLQPAPDDELSDRDSINPRPLPKNLTQALAQNLSEKTIKGGLENSLNSDILTTPNQVVNTTIQKIINEAIQEFALPKISDEEINISEDNSPEAIQQYALETIKALEGWKNSQQGSFETEVDLFSYVINNKDFSEINRRIDGYKKLYDDTRYIQTPSSLKNIQKQQMGTSMAMINIFKAVKNTDQDPIRATLALEQYGYIVKLINQTLLDLSNQVRRTQ